MNPYPHQIEIACLGKDIINKYNIVYLAMEERTGKTLTSLLIADKLEVNELLVITKAKAIEGWRETIEKCSFNFKVTITSYASAHKIAGDFKVIILDEAHSNIGGFPKKSKTLKTISKLTKRRGVKIIYISATPYAENLCSLYHQLYTSFYTPFKCNKFTDWLLAVGGSIEAFFIGVTTIKKYKLDKTKELSALIDPLFVIKTRKEIGMMIEPEDKVHQVDMKGTNYEVIKEYLINNSMVNFRLKNGGTAKLTCGSKPKLRATLHMLEGGVFICDSGDLVTTEDLKTPITTRKVDYIKKVFGECKNDVIMHYFRAEEKELTFNFPHAKILQSEAFSEGVDLSEYTNLIIYSMGYSATGYIQRRCRQINPKNRISITVHYIIGNENDLSSNIYRCVREKKKNFTLHMFNTAIQK